MDIQEVMPEVHRLATSDRDGDKIDAAILLAQTAFRGQYRYPGTARPAITHSLGVGLALQAFDDDTTTIVGGICHDLVEDTKVTADMLALLFDNELASLVLACTLNEKLYKADELAGNKDLIARVRAYGERAVKVKIADVTNNLLTIGQVPKNWQEEMLWCAEQYLSLGTQVLGASAPHTQTLAARLRQLGHG